MAGSADILAAVQRKYDIQQQQADSERTLREAQATQITSSTPYENALRAAQAYSTTEQGRTLGPLAAASAASTYADIPVKGAQAGLLGAQTGYTGAEAGALNASTLDKFGEASLPEWQAYHNAVNQKGFGLSTQSITSDVPTNATSQGPAARPSQAQPTNGISITDPANAPWRRRAAGIIDVPQGFAAGTPNVQPKGKAPVAPPMPVGGPPHIPGVHPLAHAVATAMTTLHAAGGATDVKPLPTPTIPAPGQTTTSGSWDASQVTNPAYGQNQNLRRTLGLGVKAAKGLTKVPGKGAPNVDKVPATLAPGEAVLNQGAAAHMGRGAIAMLNSLGAQHMAQQGFPPPAPTASGTSAPAPKKGVARGAPPPKAKAKVAAGAGRR